MEMRNPIQTCTIDSLLEDYGITDIEQLRYVLDQYQKIIIEITNGQMSYLTYPAETVLACAEDKYREYWEEELISKYAEVTKHYDNC